MRRTPRPRRTYPAWMRPLVRVAFRYSQTRGAYVLRGIGHRYGPVLLAPPRPDER